MPGLQIMMQILMLQKDGQDNLGINIIITLSSSESYTWYHRSDSLSLQCSEI